MACLTEEIGSFHLVKEIFLAFLGIITHLKICETVPLAGHTKVTKINQIALTQNPVIQHFNKKTNCSIEFLCLLSLNYGIILLYFFTAPPSVVYCVYLLLYSMILCHQFVYVD